MYGNESELAEEKDREIPWTWDIATFLVAGDMCVFHRTEAAHVRKRDGQESFNILTQRNNSKCICGPSETLKKK